MTYGSLHRDVVSFFDDTESLRFKDVSNAINDAIAQQRIGYIQSGQGYEFVESETLYVTIKDLTYPFLYSVELDKNLMRSLPISQTVRNSVFWKSEDELEDSVQSWSKGDKVVKDNYLYEATEDISSLNTYDLTFVDDNVKRYYDDVSDIKFVADDIVYDGTSFYKCDTTYTKTSEETVVASGNFTKVYWRKIGIAFVEGTYVPFGSLHEMKLADVITDHVPFSILENTVYTSVSKVPLTISYIPEWTYVESMDSDLDIPDSMRENVKRQSIQILANKLGVQVNLQTEEDEG